MVPICEDLVKKLVEWREHLKTKSKDVSPAAFIFRGRFGGPLDPSNFRKRVLHKLAEELELPKLTFQVIRRTIATLAQKLGSSKDVQGFMRHETTDTTENVYMQSPPGSAYDARCNPCGVVEEGGDVTWTKATGDTTRRKGNEGLVEERCIGDTYGNFRGHYCSGCACEACS